MSKMHTTHCVVCNAVCVCRVRTEPYVDAAFFLNIDMSLPLKQLVGVG